jgi:integrase
MPLELRWKLSGPIRPYWYGRYEINGKRFCQNLGVKIAGTPPKSGSLKEEGDGAFERSRAAAQAKLDSLVDEAQSKRHASILVEKLYEIKTGEAMKSVKLADLADEWSKIRRKRIPNARYAAQCQSTLKRFAAYVKEHNPKAHEIAQVTRTLAGAFLDAEEARSVTGKTWNDTLKLLRATFRHLLPAGAINPFSDVPSRDTDTVFRHPFTPEDLAAITDAARADEFIRPIIVVGMCTAMRRGDCCLLDWKDVDLVNKFIAVKTSKTGQTVSIPIFPMLYEELRAKAEMGQGGEHPTSNIQRSTSNARSGGRDAAETRRQDACATPKAGYVFPEQARMYLENPDGITFRVKKILAVALGRTTEDGGLKSVATPEMGEAEVRKRGEDYIARLPEGEKRERMGTVFRSYMDGKKVCDVAEANEVSKGSVSGYLNEIEKAIECRVVRGHGAGKSMAQRLNADNGLLWVKRKGSNRRASVRDFHSFRVTWVTLALTAGVPLELVQKVTGHKTTDIVLKHYFQPGREAFREALQKAMPALLTGGSAERGTGNAEQTLEEDGGQMTEASAWETEKEAVREIVRKSTAETWKRDRKLLLTLLRTRGQAQRGQLANLELEVG